MLEQLLGIFTLELIVGIFTLVAIFLGFCTVVILWGHDADIEKYYRETVVKTLMKPGYLPVPIVDVPKEIIVDSQRSYSPLRIFLKQKLAQMLGKEVPPVILVFGQYSEEEQKAFLIEKAFASSVEARLLDLDFLESLIYYLANKHVHEFEGIDQKVRTILRRNFENSKFRDSMVKLDSLDFSAKVVLNPPPEKRPLLTNVVLPMVREKEKGLLVIKASIAEIEEWKSFFMKKIEQLCSRECAVLFIGIREVTEYMRMLEERLEDFDCFIISARGIYILAMSAIIEVLMRMDEEKPLEERLLSRCERRDIIGKWEFPGEETVGCHWVIFTKREEDLI